LEEEEDFDQTLTEMAEAEITKRCPKTRPSPEKLVRVANISGPQA
jgi:hypothetical protein